MSKRRRRNCDLFDAIVLNDYATAERLLNEGADVNARHREHDETALMFAVQFADERMVELLLKRGADVNASDVRGEAALLRAPVSSPVFDLLLSAGADVNAVDKEGKTKLIRDVWLGEFEDLESVRRLLELGIAVDARDEGGYTALDWANELGFLAVAQLLREVGAQE